MKLTNFNFIKFINSFGPKPKNLHHNWEKNGKSICPFTCSHCGALSGTNAAVESCPNGTEPK